MACIMTNHGEGRVRGRLGVSKKLANSIGDTALKEGLSRSNFTGSIRRYLDKLSLSYGGGYNIRVYHQKIFIFKGGVLITMLNLPHRYHEVVKKMVDKLTTKALE